MAKKQARKDGKPVAIDTKTGSLTYNRFEMQEIGRAHV